MLRLWLVFIFTVVNVFALKQELVIIPKHVQASILVYDYQHKKTLYQLMSNKLMNAASTVKLFTAIAVVDELGENFKFKTKIAITGKIKKHVLYGDVWLRFSGDPSFDLDKLMSLLLKLKQHGVQKIQGDIYLWGGSVANAKYAPGWMIDDIDHCYGAPISIYNFNQNCVVVSADKPKNTKHRPRISLSVPHGVKVKNQLYWRKSCKKSSLMQLTSSGDGYVWRGCFSQQHFADEVAIKSIKPWVLSAVALGMKKSRLQYSGKISFVERGPKQKIAWQSFVDSDSVDAMLAEVLKKSNNFYASSLFLQLGKRNGFDFNWGHAANWLTKYLHVFGISAPSLIDGSGLSRLNKVSAGDLVNVLTHIINNQTMKLVVNNLSIVGVDGTLKFVKIKFSENTMVFGKTGSMEGVDAIAGYLLADGEIKLVYALILNGTDADQKIMRQFRNAWLEKLATMG